MKRSDLCVKSIYSNWDMEIYLTSIQCNVNDETDGDEIFIKYDGKRVWPAGLYKSIKTGEKVSIEKGVQVPDDEFVTFELWDYDILTKNDLLGTFTMRTNEKGGPFQTSLKIEKPEYTASYLLTWEGR